MKTLTKIAMLAAVCVASLTLASCNKDGGSSEPATNSKWRIIKTERLFIDGSVQQEYLSEGEYILEFKQGGNLSFHSEYEDDAYDIQVCFDLEGTFIHEDDIITVTFTHGKRTITYADGTTETYEGTLTDGDAPFDGAYEVLEFTNDKMVWYDECYECPGTSAYNIKGDMYYFKRIN